jgi:hypothetical protein
LLLLLDGETHEILLQFSTCDGGDDDVNVSLQRLEVPE